MSILKSLARTAAILGALALAPAAHALPIVDLHADTAPNVFGSPSWPAWWDDTKTDVVAGTFVNMRSGANPGTNNFTATEEIVYSTGDLGQRLHWIYWVPGVTTADLDGLFEVKMVIDWDGVAYTYAGGGLAVDDANTGWAQPGSWENYAGGVIGSMGHAWWASDDLAPPANTDGSPYNETDAADVAALAAQVYDFQTFATGMVRYRDDIDDDWTTTSLRLNLVPAPATAPLLVLALAGALLLRRRRTDTDRG